MTLIAIAERYGPIGLALAVTAIAAYYGPNVFAQAQESDWKLPNLYGSVFDLSSLVAAFLFGFFTFARAAETDFLAAIKKTETFRRFMLYLARAMSASALLVVLSLPLVVVEPQPVSATDLWTYYCSLWAGITVFVILATWRSMAQFILIAMKP